MTMRYYKVEFEGEFVIAAHNEVEAERISKDCQADHDLVADWDIQITNIRPSTEKP